MITRRGRHDAGRTMITRRGLLIGSVLGAGAFAAGFAVARWRAGESPAPRTAAGESAWDAAGDRVIRSSSAEPADKAADFRFTDQHGEERPASPTGTE